MTVGKKATQIFGVIQILLSVKRLSVWMGCVLLVPLILGFSVKKVFSQESEIDKALIESAMIYKLINFIEWPVDSYKKTNDLFTVIALGDNPIMDSLKLFEKETIKNRRVKVIQIKKVEDLEPCQILYISPQETHRLKSILLAINKSGTLTIGHSENFALHGGIFNFFMKRDKMRFEINLGAAKEAGLHIRAQLLKLSKIVATQTP